MDEKQLNDQLRLAVALAKGNVIRRWSGMTTGALYAMVVPPDEFIEDSMVVDKFPEGMGYSFQASIPNWPHSFEAAHGLLEEVNASQKWAVTIMNCQGGSWWVAIQDGIGNANDCTGQDMSLCRAICEAYILWCEKKGQG